MPADPATSSPSLPASVPAPRPAPGRLPGTPHPEAALPPGGRAAWLAWGIGVSVYVLAVIHRTSLGVAGLDAAHRFSVGASALSAFSILQVLVYAAMQIPVGLLVDRYGPRRVLLAGVLLLSAGQLAFAFSTSFGPALASRAVLGCGDAMTFISVLRIAARWFPAARNPLVAQLTGLAGMGGNLVTTVVLARALHTEGWTTTFAGTALLGVAVFALVALWLREVPPGPSGQQSAAPVADGPQPSLLARIRECWHEPGTRLGLWVHFTTQFPGNAFSLLWGLPYLVEGQGMSRGGAAGLLTLLVLSNMAFGLLFGRLLSRSSQARMPITLGVIAGTSASWAAALAWPGGHPPFWLLLLLIVAMGSNGPGSLVGLEYARAHNPGHRLGTASGIANMGGFVATMLTLLGVGLLLDAVSGGAETYSAGAFRIAFCWLAVPMAVGTAMVLRLHRQVGRAAATA
ncbi:MFS transporter [Kitasatospora viridis]|uniref:Putative MFS family arabinose efflux permease n=1 Tax=Kitasatospora viridis TaxID=281105 RepID=A0A561UHN6_9ACTN|nr:MFS transporter [Kitasatospora viridis]TWF98864.1 putative MFS family arabinose efflux permease [Kitasatospora viridis]